MNFSIRNEWRQTLVANMKSNHRPTGIILICFWNCNDSEIENVSHDWKHIWLTETFIAVPLSNYIGCIQSWRRFASDGFDHVYFTLDFGFITFLFESHIKHQWCWCYFCGFRFWIRKIMNLIWKSIQNVCDCRWDLVAMIQ